MKKRKIKLDDKFISVVKEVVSHCYNSYNQTKGIQFKDYGDIINSIVNGNVNDFYLGYLENFSKSQLKMVNKSLKNKRNTKSEIDYYKNQKKIFIYLCDWFEKNPNPSVIVI